MSSHTTTPSTQRRDSCPEIRISDSTVSAIRSLATVRSNGGDTTVHRKLRRRTGDRKVRSCHCRLPTMAGATSLFLLAVLLACTRTTFASAYLNGATPDSNPPVPAKNERYTFLTRPRDRYFTSTGILPPLSPSFDPEMEQQALRLPLPPKTTNDASNSNGIDENNVLVTYTNDPRTVDEWLCQNVPYDGCFLGFDIERLPECRSENPHATDRLDFAHAAVVQLATPTSCLVVHLVDSSSVATHHHHHHPKHSNGCARILRSVLEDPSVIKAGCSIDEDLVLLHELWGGMHKGSSKNKHNNNANGKKNGSKKNQRTKPNKPKQPKDVAAKTKTSGHRHQRTIHVPSLQARSRFDLGCVVLPKPQTNSGASHGSIASNLRDPSCWLSSAEEDGEDSCQYNYKIVAKRAETIPNKSGLQGLCRSILGVDLPKEKTNSASDWTRFPLTDDQITYAARDAWAGVAIATELASMNVEHTSNPDDDDDEYESSSSSSNVFSRSNLIKVLRRVETPLPQLAHRHRQRKEAKTELQTLLHPYAKNLFLNQQNRRRHEKLQQEQQQQEQAMHSNSTQYDAAPPKQKRSSKKSKNNNYIDVEALFASHPLSSRRTLANFAQQQQQLMEKSLPKHIRRRSIVLRQMVNAKVIDHKVVFQIDVVDPNEEVAPQARVPSTGRKQKNPHHHHHQQHHYSRGRKRRRNHHRGAGGRDSNAPRN